MLVGHGRMGQLVARMAPAYDFTIAGILTSRSEEDAIERAVAEGARMAIDFSQPPAVPTNLPRLAAAGVSVVIGTTGWHAQEAELRAVAARYEIGVLAASNFSLGMHIFRALVEDAARRFGARADVGAWIHEAHHDKKKDAPSGTAVTLNSAMIGAGYPRAIDMSSTRAGSIPGTHTVGFDGPSETVTLTHAVRDRAVFAEGALEAATWLEGKRGWFTIDDMLAG
ncbi:MAG TPA: dihydrodipicolinate reductase C-terminal domain-containing protein [Vicinamibacterales bacterium]|nr:dihydrodipicolinate reductase C-terminal domain-containing protein [Vicinamibacterales bacterium]